MGLPRNHFRSHPYFLATGSWPPPGYDGLGDASSEGAEPCEHEKVELDDDRESFHGRDGRTDQGAAIAVTVDQGSVLPASGRRRTCAFRVDSGISAQEPSASAKSVRESGLPPDAQPGAPEEPDLAVALRKVAEYMFLRPGEEPIASNRPRDQPLARELTYGLVVAVKDCISDLYERCRGDVCLSPERPDLPLSQEEAIGYLMAGALGRPLLAAPDARPFGKRIDSKATAIQQQLT